MSEQEPRCDLAINISWYPGASLPPAEAPGVHTRCSLGTYPHHEHVGRGLPQFDEQRMHWFSGDRRTYRTTREDGRAWESP